MRERADAYRPHIGSPSLRRGRPGRLLGSVVASARTPWQVTGRKPGVAGLGRAGWTMIVAVHSQVGAPPNLGKGARPGSLRSDHDPQASQTQAARLGSLAG